MLLFSKRYISSYIGFSIGTKAPSLAGLSARLPPIPSGITGNGLGMGVPSTLFTRALSVTSSAATTVEEIEETTVSKTETVSLLGTTLEASENLQAILSKIATGTDRFHEVDSSGRVGGQMMNQGTLVLVDFQASWCGPYFLY